LQFAPRGGDPPALAGRPPLTVEVVAVPSFSALCQFAA